LLIRNGPSCHINAVVNANKFQFEIFIANAALLCLPVNGDAETRVKILETDFLLKIAMATKPPMDVHIKNLSLFDCHL